MRLVSRKTARPRSSWYDSVLHPPSTPGANLKQTQRDLPAEFLITSRPLRASLVIASFGDAKGYRNHVFDFEVRLDPDHPIPIPEKPLRYGKLDEIHHTFRPDPKSPPKIVTFFFTAAVLATLPILVGAVCLDLLV